MLRQLIGRQAPGLEKFYSGMMRTGGMDGIGGLANQTFLQNQGDVISRIMAQGGLGSTGQMRAMGKETGQAGRQHALDLAKLGMGAQFQGAAGMQQLPGLLVAPSGLEQQMLGLRSRYDLANLGADVARQSDLSNFYNTMWQTNWGAPTQVYEPSWWEKYGPAILGGASQMGAAALGPHPE